MKIIKVRFKTLVSLVSIMAFVSLLVGEYAYPEGEHLDSLRRQSSQTLGAGWLNRHEAKGAAEALESKKASVEIMDQADKGMQNQDSVREPVIAEVKGPRGGAEVKVTNVKSVIEYEYVLPGDANGDGYVGIADLSMLAGHWGAKKGEERYDERVDFYQDGVIDVIDLGVLASNWGCHDSIRMPKDDNNNHGDANGDGYVGIADLSTLAGHWGAKKGEKRYDERVDFYQDGVIDAVDLGVLASNWSKTFYESPTVSTKGNTVETFEYVYHPLKFNHENFSKMSKDLEDLRKTIANFSDIINNKDAFSRNGKKGQLILPEVKGKALPEKTNKEILWDIQRIISDSDRFTSSINNNIDEAKINAMVADLYGKYHQDNQPSVQKDMLTLSIAAIEDKAFMDQETWEEYRVVIKEALEGILEGVDFRAIRETMGTLVKEQKALYMNYLDETDTFYSRLAELFEIDAENDSLPHPFTAMKNIDERARRKILVDVHLEKLRGKDKELVTENGEVKSMYDKLQARRAEYTKALNKIIQRFTFILKNVLEDKKQTSIESDKDSIEALLVLDKENGG